MSKVYFFCQRKGKMNKQINHKMMIFKILPFQWGSYRTHGKCGGILIHGLAINQLICVNAPLRVSIAPASTLCMASALLTIMAPLFSSCTEA